MRKMNFIIFICIIFISLNMISCTKEEETIKDNNKGIELLEESKKNLSPKGEKADIIEKSIDETTKLEENESIRNEEVPLNDQELVFTHNNNFYIEDQKLFFIYKNNDFLISDIQESGLRDAPKYEIISSNKEDEYIALYYSYPSVGFKGYNYYFYILKYDKQEDRLTTIWNGSEVSIKHSFENKNMSIVMNNRNETLTDTFNIEEVVNNKKKIAKFILEGDLTLSTISKIGIKDYDMDNNSEILLRYDIFNTQRNVYLTSMYLALEISDDTDVSIKKMFLSDSYELLDSFFEDGYFDIDIDLPQHLINKDVFETKNDRVYFK